MISITATIVGAESVSMNLRAAPARVRLEVRKSVYQLGLEIERIAKEQMLAGQVLHRRSGRLARSVNTVLSESGDTISASVGTNVIYGAAWELGFHLPEREIVPINRKALFWPGASHPVRSVRQPARDVSARPWLRPSLNAVRPKVADTIAAAVQRGLRGVQ